MIDLGPVMQIGLLLVRPGMLVVVVPMFGGAYAPSLLKVGFTAIFGMSLLPLVTLPDVIGPAALTLVVLRELLVGLALGFVIRVLIAGAEFAGHLAGFQLGFTYASVVDPQSGVRNGIVSALYGTVALMVFFAINAHHEMLRALARSYEIIPVGTGRVGAGIAPLVMQLLGLLFTLGAQLAAPVVVVLLVTELALGLLSRAAPTLNLMQQGFPIRLIVGLLTLAAMVHVIPGVIARHVPAVLELGGRLAAAFR